MEWEFVMEAKDVDGPWEEWRGDVWTTTDELVCNPSNFDGKRRAIARRIVKEHNSHAALVEALRALADLAEVFDDERRSSPADDDEQVMEWPRIDRTFILRVGHLRAARAALALAGETP
jgi:hypothetical protein